MKKEVLFSVLDGTEVGFGTDVIDETGEEREIFLSEFSRHSGPRTFSGISFFFPIK